MNRAAVQALLHSTYKWLKKLGTWQWHTMIQQTNKNSAEKKFLLKQKFTQRTINNFLTLKSSNISTSVQSSNQRKSHENK